MGCWRDTQGGRRRGKPRSTLLFKVAISVMGGKSYSYTIVALDTTANAFASGYFCSIENDPSRTYAVDLAMVTAT